MPPSTEGTEPLIVSIGTSLRFRTRKSQIYWGHSSDDWIEWSGVVNGEIVTDGDRVYVPVWCDRVGKGDTTILVAEKNVIGPTDRA